MSLPSNSIDDHLEKGHSYKIIETATGSQFVKCEDCGFVLRDGQ